MDTGTDSKLAYWTGKNRNYLNIWDDFKWGEPYISTFSAAEPYVLQLRFKEYSKEQPLYNFEAVYSTVKGVFHDIKRVNLNEEEYNAANPIYLYETKRGSEIWTWLGGLYLLLRFGLPLVERLQHIRGEEAEIQRARAETKKLILEERKTKLELIGYFPNASLEEKSKLFMAQTTPEIDAGLDRLVNQGLDKVYISQLPFSKHKKGRRKMINVEKISKKG